MQDFAKALSTAKKGTRIVPVGRSLIHTEAPEKSQLKLLATKQLPYYFGYPTVFFHEKL